MAVSPTWAAAQERGGVEVTTMLTVTTPGGASAELTVTKGTVAQSATIGSRWTASVSIDAEPGQNSRALVTTPGALFRLSQTLTAGTTAETLPLGVYGLAARPKNARTSGIDLVLADQWKRITDARFVTPYTTPLTHLTAGEAIRGLVLGAVPDATIVPGDNLVNSTASYVTSEERDRGVVLQRYARDFDLDLHFDGEGAFRIDPAHTIDVEHGPVATFLDRAPLGNGARVTMRYSETEQPYEAVINAVRCIPPDIPSWPAGSIPWTAFTVGVNQWDPRHRSRVGAVMPIFYQPELPISRDQATRNAARFLTAYGRGSRTSIKTWLSPQIAPGDTVLLHETATWHEPEHVGLQLVESNIYDLFTLENDIVVRNGDLVEMEEID